MDPNLIIGNETGDDAAVYALAPDQAVVFTVDALTPIHDDPHVFGEIVAANCLSDVWAMGARPILAINVCGFPQVGLPPEILTQILHGGMSKAAGAGVTVAGGHTMSNPEPYYGMAVLGLVDPHKLVSNAGAQPGDQLVLTKPLGTGVLVTAMLGDKISEEELAALTASMTALNKAASETMVEFGAHAATDITGFGLIGHAQVLAQASGVGLRFWWDRLPLLPGALRHAAEGTVTGGGASNREYYGQDADFGAGSEAQIELVCDPQTSGGLLIALPEDALEPALETMASRGVQVVHVGEVEAEAAGRLTFLGEGTAG